MIYRLYPGTSPASRERLVRPLHATFEPGRDRDEGAFELLEQMRIIPLLHVVDGDTVEFADLGDVLSRNPQRSPCRRLTFAPAERIPRGPVAAQIGPLTTTPSDDITVTDISPTDTLSFDPHTKGGRACPMRREGR